MRARAALWVVLLAAMVPYVVGLGDSTIWDANEAFYAETARQMLESGDYVNPSFNGRPRFNKPVLSYWAVAASYHLFGVSERSERLPIALAAMVLMATTFVLGRAAARGMAGAEARAALFAAVALATTPRFLMFSRRIIIDIWVTMFLALTLLFFVLAEQAGDPDPQTPNPERRIPNPESRAPNPRKRFLLLMYIAAGLGVLTKGPVAAVLPALTFLAYLALERRLGDLRRLMIPTGVAILAAIVLPWYIALYAQHGWVYIKEFFVDENLMRYAQPVGAPRRGLFFYPPVVFSDIFPWSLLLPAALAGAWRAFRRPWSAQPRARAQRLLVLWIVGIVLFFSFSRTKQDLYVFSIVPAEAALIGLALAGGATRLLVSCLAATGTVVALLGVALVALGVAPVPFHLAGSSLVALVALAGGALVVLAAWRRRPAAGALALASTFAVLSWVFVLVSLPDFERYKPVAPLVSLIKQRATPGGDIGYYRFAMPSMTFYLRRPVFEHFDLESLQRTFASGREVHCLMTAEDYRAVRDVLMGPTYIVASRPLFDAKLRSVLDGTVLPDIVLVSNRP